MTARSTGVEVRPYSQSQGEYSDESDVLKLREQCFPEILGTERESLEYWRWKHGTIDVEIDRTAWVCRNIESGNLLGYYSAVLMPYLSPSGRLRIGLVCDVMTAPEARGQGIFTAIGHIATSEMLTSHFDWLTGYPIRENVLPGHRKVGWFFTHKLPIYVSVGGTISWVRSTCSRVKDGISVNVSEPKILTVEDGFSTFCENWELEAKDKGLLYLDLHEKFVKWRYSPPGIEYVSFIARNRAGEMIGYLIARKMKVGRIWIVAVGDIRVTSRTTTSFLILAMTRHFNQRNMIFAGMFSDEVVRATGINKCGFFKTYKKFQLILKSNDVEMMGSVRPYLSWSDTDDM